MNKKNGNRGENNHTPACLHCGAGGDEKTVGLYWDTDEHCWRCVICGYRGYEHTIRPRTKAEIIAERLWDEIVDTLDEEKEKAALL
jgi:hypothetical protein